MGIQERAEQKLAAGEWLSTGEAAVLLGIDKTTVIRMAKADPPAIRSKVKLGVGGYRLIDPTDVAKMREGGQAPSA